MNLFILFSDNISFNRLIDDLLMFKILMSRVPLPLIVSLGSLIVNIFLLYLFKNVQKVSILILLIHTTTTFSTILIFQLQNYSRLNLFLLIFLIPLLFVFKTKGFLPYFFLDMVIIICSVLLIYNESTKIFEQSIQYKLFEDCLNQNSLEFEIDNNVDSVYVVGHAFGNHKNINKALSNQLLYYFYRNIDNQNSDLILTGDFIRKPTPESYKLLEKQTDSFFNNTYLSIGNHEEEKINLYNDYYNEDLFIFEKGKNSFIIANFSTQNWLPKSDSLKTINEYLKDKKNQTVFIFSHQLFWINFFENNITPNSYGLLLDGLPKSPLEFINNQNNDYIFISGDYGLNSNISYFCEDHQNYKYIANGIFDRPNDLILEIVYDSKNFKFIIHEIGYLK